MQRLPQSRTFTSVTLLYNLKLLQRLFFGSYSLLSWLLPAFFSWLLQPGSYSLFSWLLQPGSYSLFSWLLQPVLLQLVRLLQPDFKALTARLLQPLKLLQLLALLQRLFWSVLPPSPHTHLAINLLKKTLPHLKRKFKHIDMFFVISFVSLRCHIKNHNILKKIKATMLICVPL